MSARSCRSELRQWFQRLRQLRARRACSYFLRTPVLRVAAALLILLGAAGPLHAQTGENVAVVINDASAASQRIGEYYVRQRAVPGPNVIHIRTTEDESIDRMQYARTIEAPIAAALRRERLQDRILYIVLTKGVPLRISGTGGLNGTVSSVDSELTLLYRRLTGVDAAIPGFIQNPYYLADRPVADAKPFTHRDYDIFLVTRLDAFTVEQALALVDKAKAPSTDGKIVLDQRVPLVNRTGDDWLETAAERLKAMGDGDRVVLESTVQGARDISPVLGYYSWGSNDPRNRVRRTGMGFVPGSLAAMFVSSDARTFKQPPANWVPDEAGDKDQQFEGSAQSLVADLIAEGATGVAGHVAEPYLQSTVRPQILFPAYLSGMNLAEAFYLAIPHLGWQTVVIGDPLLAPFRRKAERPDLDSRIDPETLLPEWFSKRRVDATAAQAPGAPARAIALTVRADGQMTRDDRSGARASLEEATKVAPDLAGPQLQLALLYEAAGDRALAIARYERVIELQPNQALALNNLAYTLAINEKDPARALPLARRAAAAAPRQGTIVDTLAWVEYLAGDIPNAVRHVTTATLLSPDVAEIRLHAAVIQAAAGARAVAEDELKRALQLDPGLASREEVKQARDAIAKSK